MITEENREKARRGEKILLGRYRCVRCFVGGTDSKESRNGWIEHRYFRGIRSVAHIEVEGPPCRSDKSYSAVMEQVAPQRDAEGERAAFEEYTRIGAMNS